MVDPYLTIRFSNTNGGAAHGEGGSPGHSAKGRVIGDGLEEDEELRLEAQPLGVRGAGEGGELKRGEPRDTIVQDPPPPREP